MSVSWPGWPLGTDAATFSGFQPKGAHPTRPEGARGYLDQGDQGRATAPSPALRVNPEGGTERNPDREQL